MASHNVTEVLIVIRKNGDKFIPEFPVELEEGDQFVIAMVAYRYQVPKDNKLMVCGYTISGPLTTEYVDPHPGI